MRSRYPGICIALAALILVSCATPTLYAPMDGEFGYADELTGPAKAKVTFYGNPHTPRDTVETYLLYRAAELTIENGYAVFAVRGAQTEAVTEYRANGDGICESLFYHRGFAYSAFGFPWSVQAADPAAQRFEASAHVVFMNGEPAHPGEDTYIADAIIQWLMPCIHRPGNAR